MRKKVNFTRIVAGFVGFAMVLSMVGGAGVNGASAQTVQDLQAQIAQLLATINMLQAQLAAMTGGTPPGGSMMSSVCPYTWTRDLTMSATGQDVMYLQQFLNSDPMTQLAASGAGSPGQETQYFGSITRGGAKKFQEKYASEILTPLGLTAGTGYVGPSTRAKLNMLCATAPTPTPDPGPGPGPSPTPDPTPTPTPIPTGGDVSVSKAGNQPENGLAVASASRVPFTRVTFSAGASGAVIDSLVVERTGLSVDANFSGIVLLDENANQIGLAKTLNANHQVTLSEDFTIPANSSRTMTIAGNMAASGTMNNGEIASLDVVSVNPTGGTVSGTLPIRGASHTMNNTLAIGTAAMSLGSLDPNAALTKDIGSTGFNFASVKVTAGTNEKIRLMSIRWNQTGSASDSDLANLKTRVDGVDYNMTVDSTGKYYTANFGAGIVIDKGAQKEASVRGDIANGSNRTVVFDIHKDTDIYVKGELYGFGIIATQSQNGTAASTGSQFTSGTPFFDASHITIGTGSLTVKKSQAVAGQSVAENTLNTPIAAFDVEAKGEPVSVGRIDFYFGVTGTGNGGDMTSVSLYDANGSAIAGPADATLATTAGYRVRFTDTVVFPVGINTYTLKGKYGTDFANSDTVVASTTPSTDFATVTGQDTGDTITPSPTSPVEGPTMTIRAPDIKVSVLSTPVAQTIVAGNPFVFAKYQMDATASGDDIQFTSLKLAYDATNASGFTGGQPTNLTGCTLLDGTTELNTGSNRVNPTATDADANFIFDNPLVVPKGVLKTLDLRCATTATSTQSFRWGIDTLANAANQATGVNSGTTLSTAATGFTVTTSVGQAITLSTGGSYVVSDDSTPGYSIVTPGTDVTLLKLNFTASNEDMIVKRVAFELGSTASNTPVNLVGQKVTLWDGATQVGDATFDSQDNATSTLTGVFQVPAGGSKSLTVKGTISAINKDAGPLTNSGDLLVVVYDANDRNATTPSSGGNYAMGAAGGTSVVVTAGSDITPTGVRIMKAYPKFSKVALSSSEKVLQNGSSRILYKFKVEAVGGDVAIAKFTMEHSSSTGGSIAAATTSNYAMYIYTDDQFSTRDSTHTSAGGTPGLFNSANCYVNENGQSQKTTVGIAGSGIEVWADKNATACSNGTFVASSSPYKIPSGQSRWFEFRADITGTENVTGSESFEVKLRGDAAFSSDVTTVETFYGATALTTNMGSAQGIDSSAHDDLIWTPISTTTTQALRDLDWTNGYFVPGLPGADMTTETIQSAN